MVSVPDSRAASVILEPTVFMSVVPCIYLSCAFSTSAVFSGCFALQGAHLLWCSPALFQWRRVMVPCYEIQDYKDGGFGLDLSVGDGGYLMRPL